MRAKLNFSKLLVDLGNGSDVVLGNMVFMLRNIRRLRLAYN